MNIIPFPLVVRVIGRGDPPKAGRPFVLLTSGLMLKDSTRIVRGKVKEEYLKLADAFSAAAVRSLLSRNAVLSSHEFLTEITIYTRRQAC